MFRRRPRPTLSPVERATQEEIADYLSQALDYTDWAATELTQPGVTLQSVLQTVSAHVGGERYIFEAQCVATAVEAVRRSQHHVPRQLAAILQAVTLATFFHLLRARDTEQAS